MKDNQEEFFNFSLRLEVPIRGKTKRDEIYREVIFANLSYYCGIDIIVPLRQPYYKKLSKKKNPFGLSPKTLSRYLKVMQEEGHLTIIKGRRDGVATRIRGLGSQKRRVIENIQERVVLNSPKGRTLSKSKIIRQSKDLLQSYDRMMSQKSITLNSKPQRVFLRRIFTHNYASGGRFYHRLQGLKKAQRGGLRVDGESLIEGDYISMAPMLCYALVGKPAPEGGHYSTKNFTRKQGKVALQILLNSNSREQALRAVKFHVGEECEALVSTLEEKHEAIASLFFTGVGLRLQFLESQLCLEVITFFTERDKFILPWHDGFLVKGRDSELLKEAMKRASLIYFNKSFPKRIISLS